MKKHHAAVWFMIVGLVAGAQQVKAETWVRVERAVDGDTLRLKDGRLVRYIGINTPEIDHAGHRAEPFGLEAYQVNQHLVDGKKVRLQIGTERKDPYGRILACVYTEQGQMVDLILIARGLGYVYACPSSDPSLGHVLLSAQRQAMQQQVGMWKKLCLKNGPFIANTRTKRFHTGQCQFGRAIGSKYRVCFTSLWDAYWQGYAPCDRCLSSSIKKGLKHR